MELLDLAKVTRLSCRGRIVLVWEETLMLAVKKFKGCRRCGGDLLEEPGVTQMERQVRYVSCLLCGDLTFIVAASAPINREELRGRPGRPRKLVAV